MIYSAYLIGRDGAYRMSGTQIVLRDGENTIQAAFAGVAPIYLVIEGDGLELSRHLVTAIDGSPANMISGDNVRLTWPMKFSIEPA